MVFFLSHSRKGISLSSQSVNIRALVKVLILTTGILQRREASTIFPVFLNRRILFLEWAKKGQTYISNILTLFEYILIIKIKTKH